MNILLLTWKDKKHPHAGGAEKVIYEYAKGLVKKGHSVTWFASIFSGAKSEEEIEGVKIVRKYSNNTIWLFAWFWYRRYKRNHTIDIIVDEAGGWPLLSPLYEKNIPLFFCANHIGDKEFDTYPFPLGYLSRIIYRSLFHIYKNIPTITISESTQQELIHDFGFSPQLVSVVDMTTDITPLSEIDFSQKTNDILFLGRLTTIKRPDHAILAFYEALGKIPEDSKLHIIGNTQDRKYTQSLEKLITRLGIKERVIIHGFLEKVVFNSIISQSKCILVPSFKEGYGLIVIEANAFGVPAIGYDVPGLRDSIKNGTNGLLVPDGDYKSMGKEIVNLFANTSIYNTLCKKSLTYAKSMPTWAEQAEKFEKIILQKH